MMDSLPFVMIAGVIAIAATHIRQTCLRLQVQPLVGFVLVGLVIGLADEATGLLTPEVRDQLGLLGQFGVLILLFKVGLESDITGLMRQLRRAVAIWFSNVTVAALVGFTVTYYVLGYSLLPALFVGTALSATSIGVSAAVWQQAGRLETEDGALIIDVAELDDITAILLMVLLFTAAPLLVNGETHQLGELLPQALLWMLGKLAVFLVSVYLFARFAERPFTRSSHDLGGLTVAVTGMACLIAGVAAWIGLSTAIGAMFAGLAFSRDPEEFQIDQQLEPLYQLFSPFFFVAIGLGFAWDSAWTSLAVGLTLFAAALIGKLAGAGLPAMLMLDSRRGWLIGISMVPRAEIAMIIMLQGARMGADYVPPELLGAMSLVVVATALLVPLWLGRLMPATGTPQRSPDRTDKLPP